MRPVGRYVALGLAVGFFGLFVAQWTQFLLAAGPDTIANDYETYMEATTRWLAGDGFYLPRQLEGPYLVTDGDVLYPPPILILLVPFTVIPAPVWWIVPIAVTAAVVLRHRPTAVGWLLVALCLWFPVTGVKLLHGNPGMWFMAAAGLGTLFAWPAALVLLKPTIAPFALIGVDRRSWWIALACLGAVSLIFLPMWADFITVIRDAESEMGFLYSMIEFPMIAIPVVAWLTSSTHAPRFSMAAVRARLARVSRTA